MDVNRFVNQRRRKSYRSMIGTVIEINPMEMGSRINMGCNQFVTIEDEEGSISNFVVSPSTYVVDQFRIFEGMVVEFFYDADAAIPLIYPPQYQAVVVTTVIPGVNWTMGYFNNILLNQEQSLKLNIGPGTEVVTMNNQLYTGIVANHNLIVQYTMTTRSIPPQTTPDRIIVMCDN